MNKYYFNLSDYEKYVISMRDERNLSAKEWDIFSKICQEQSCIEIFLGVYPIEYNIRHLFRRVVWTLIGKYIYNSTRYLPGWPGQSSSKVGCQVV